MKEKIIEIIYPSSAAKYFKVGSGSDLYKQVIKASIELEQLVNQEVERRIVERQLTDEQIEQQFTTPHYHYEKGHYYKVRKDRIFGAKWYRSRLTPQVTTQVPYKTEGGGE